MAKQKWKTHYQDRWRSSLYNSSIQTYPKMSSTKLNGISTIQSNVPSEAITPKSICRAEIFSISAKDIGGTIKDNSMSKPM